MAKRQKTRRKAGQFTRWAINNFRPLDKNESTHRAPPPFKTSYAPPLERELKIQSKGTSQPNRDVIREVHSHLDSARQTNVEYPPPSITNRDELREWYFDMIGRVPINYIKRPGVNVARHELPVTQKNLEFHESPRGQVEERMAQQRQESEREIGQKIRMELTERGLVVKELWEGPRHQRQRQFNEVVLYNTASEMISLCFSGATYVLLRRQFLREVRQVLASTSLPYGDRDRAINAFFMYRRLPLSERHKAITWSATIREILRE